MKILYLSPTGVLGGAEKVLVSVMAAVRHEGGIGLHLLSLSDGPLVDRARELGVGTTVLRLPSEWEELGDSGLGSSTRLGMLGSLGRRVLSQGWQSTRFLAHMRQALRRLDPDVIHSNGIKTHGLAWLTRGRRAAVLWHVHDFYGARPWARRFLRLPAVPIAAAVAVSLAVADDFRRHWPQTDTSVIANAVDTAEFCPGPAGAGPTGGNLLDELAGMQMAPCLRVGLVATYARWKGHDVFLEAAARLTTEHPGLPLRFYIIGGPIYRTRGSQFSIEELRGRANDLRLGERVGFIGFRADVAAICRALDVVVHASTAPEPFGLTIVEAMACGRAVVATLAGGAAEMVTPGENALGVPPGDPVALAEAIRVLAASTELRDRLGRNARQTACSRFGVGRLAKQWLDVYERCLEGPLPAGPLTSEHCTLASSHTH